MTSPSLPVFALLCALSPVSVANAQQSLPDWLIVPGERVGPITATTSADQLQNLFGQGNVQPTDVQVGEGFTEPGAAIYPQDQTQRIEVVWRDDSRANVKEVRLTGNSTKWRTLEGISLGSTLKEIETLNGSPFKLVGFAFDYGGTIIDCAGGQLGMLGGVDRTGVLQVRLLIVRLAPSDEAQSRPEYREVLGERDFSSSHRAMQVLNPSVYQMIVFLSR